MTHFYSEWIKTRKCLIYAIAFQHHLRQAIKKIQEVKKELELTGT
jgi:hypothetical protein